MNNGVNMLLFDSDVLKIAVCGDLLNVVGMNLAPSLGINIGVTCSRTILDA